MDRGKHAANISQQTLTRNLSMEESRYTETENEVKKLGCIWRDTGRETERKTRIYWEGN